MFSIRRRWLSLLAAGAITASGTVALAPGSAMALTCNQPTAAWMATPDGTLANGDTVPEPPSGMRVWPVGITVPGDRITFTVVPVIGPTPGFIDPHTGATSWTYTTVQANGNCVVNQPSDSDAPILLVNAAYITATITDWRTGQVWTIVVGHVVQG
ncbi:MAG: hypothetical protein JO345_08190 [Streptosporangiaceae bacterium]|nr:hypothetical protein [Streptosporangiaceae bacterium]